jgi:SM-20-related protein
MICAGRNFHPRQLPTSPIARGQSRRVRHFKLPCCQSSAMRSAMRRQGSPRLFDVPWWPMPISVKDAFDNSAIDELAAGYVVVDHWLGDANASALRAGVLSLSERGYFAPSRVGADVQRHEAAAIRGDAVCWFDADATLESEDGRRGVRPGPQVAAFLSRMVLLREHLNRTCFLSLTRLECHAARYETGAFYEAHLDTPTGSSDRIISFSHYLSRRDEGATGGCLRLHGVAAQPIDIEPLFDRLVVFQSRSVLHEVMPVAARRFSMTGWMSGR